MKNNNCVKFFVTIIFLIIMAIPCFASKENTNTLTKVHIEQTAPNKYNLNLYFTTKYTGKAFIQKQANGDYSVYITDTTINPKKAEIIYNNKSDKDIVNIKLEEEGISKTSNKKNFIKFNVKITNNSIIQLIAKTEEAKSAVTPFVFLNLFSLTTVILFATIGFIILLAIKRRNKNKKITSYTHFPEVYTFERKDVPTSLEIELQSQKQMNPHINIKNNLKTADNRSFSCFDIPLQKETQIDTNNFRSTLGETSNLMREKALKSKQTNPITQRYENEDASEFSLPMVDDINTQINNVNQTSNNGPELLSILNITPNKGFYLTTVEDMFALFGFVGDNVFLFKKFNDLSQINLQARYYDKNGHNDLYIVRIDSYKALVEISNTEMREMAVL